MSPSEVMLRRLAEIVGGSYVLASESSRSFHVNDIGYAYASTYVDMSRGRARIHGSRSSARSRRFESTLRCRDTPSKGTK
jgi:hypothetical protein